MSFKQDPLTREAKRMESFNTKELALERSYSAEFRCWNRVGNMSSSSCNSSATNSSSICTHYLLERTHWYVSIAANVTMVKVSYITCKSVSQRFAPPRAFSLSSVNLRETSSL